MTSPTGTPRLPQEIVFKIVDEVYALPDDDDSDDDDGNRSGGDNLPRELSAPSKMALALRAALPRINEYRFKHLFLETSKQVDQVGEILDARPALLSVAKSLYIRVTAAQFKHVVSIPSLRALLLLYIPRICLDCRWCAEPLPTVMSHLSPSACTAVQVLSLFAEDSNALCDALPL